METLIGGDYLAWEAGLVSGIRALGRLLWEESAVVAADHLPADLGCLFSTGEVS